MTEVANDAVIPPARKRVDQPERRLYLAIIHEALRDLNNPIYYPGAYRWLTDLRAEGPTSLTKCCQILGFDPSAVARAVRAGTRVERFSLTKNGSTTKVTEGMLVRGKSWHGAAA